MLAPVKALALLDLASRGFGLDRRSAPGGGGECLVGRERGAKGEIDRFDGDLARQLRRASMSVVLNLSEGSGSRGGRRRTRYEDALGSARETLAGLEAGHAAGYLGPVPEAVRGRFNHIIGTRVRLGQRAA